MKNIKKFLTRDVWRLDLETLNRSSRWGVQTLRVVLALVDRLSHGDITLRAMSMVYSTLLSIVPFIALSISLLKAFGVHHQIQPLLLEFLSPLGPKAGDIAENIVTFVSNMNVGVLGGVGLAVLFYTVLSLVSKVEDCFNHIWHVKVARPIAQRAGYYLSTLLIGPVLVFSAIALTATMMNAELVKTIVGIEPFGQLFLLVGEVAPYVFTILAFAMVYLFLPNTKVHFFPALVGAVVAGVTWKLAGTVFAMTVATSTNYAAVYSSLAILIIFMIWLYVSWLIFLLGQQVVFFIQHPEKMAPYGKGEQLLGRSREGLALLIMLFVARRFKAGKTTRFSRELLSEFDVSTPVLEDICDALIDQDLLAKDKHKMLLPTREPSTITLTQIINAARAANETPLVRMSPSTDAGRVEDELADLDAQRGQYLEGKTLSDLIVD